MNGSETLSKIWSKINALLESTPNAEIANFPNKTTSNEISLNVNRYRRRRLSERSSNERKLK